MSLNGPRLPLAQFSLWLAATARSPILIPDMFTTSQISSPHKPITRTLVFFFIFHWLLFSISTATAKYFINLCAPTITHCAGKTGIDMSSAACLAYSDGSQVMKILKLIYHSHPFSRNRSVKQMPLSITLMDPSCLFIQMESNKEVSYPQQKLYLSVTRPSMAHRGQSCKIYQASFTMCSSGARLWPAYLTSSPSTALSTICWAITTTSLI